MSRHQSGKLKLSPEKSRELEIDIVSQLGRLRIGFENREFIEEGMENVDETHFLSDMSDGRTLGFTNDDKVCYADVTSGTQCMTMLLRISCGRNANIEVPLLIVKNKDRNYPICSVPYNVPDIVYITRTKMLDAFCEHARVAFKTTRNQSAPISTPADNVY